MEIEILEKHINGIIADIDNLLSSDIIKEIEIAGPIKNVNEYLESLFRIRGRAELMENAVKRLKGEEV